MASTRSRACLLALGAALAGMAAAAAPFARCRDRIDAMLNGSSDETVQSPLGPIDGTNIRRFLYNGTVTGLHASFDRSQFVTLTFEGEKPARRRRGPPARSPAD